MKLRRFRVQNYKKIQDTNWITCHALTPLVGKNESGKSAIFRGLSKLNPSDGESYDGLKEFPRSRFSDEFERKDWVVSMAEFEFTDNEKTTLVKICPMLKKIESVICSRHYSGNVVVDFQIDTDACFTTESIIKHMNRLKEKLNSVTVPNKNDEIANLKTSIASFLQSKIDELNNENLSDVITVEFITQICDQVDSQIHDEIKTKFFRNVVKETAELRSGIEYHAKLENAEKWVRENMPQFIYFDRYDIIDSAVHIGEFLQKLNAESIDPRLRITKCLFDHVGLDINFLAKHASEDPNDSSSEIRRHMDERAIYLSSASTLMTKKFASWWEQRKHSFRYQLDGQFFRVWVSDDLDSSEIELDQRSAGMQYFFSFYLVFLVESKRSHKNSIILLDEPGIHYHGTAQMKAVEFLRKLSKTNQVLYTTHSPFMIDGGHLEEVKIVHENLETGSTEISDDVHTRDKESMFPLQAGLGYSIAQTLFQGKKQFIVEGLTDYSLFQAMNDLLSKKEMTVLDEDIIITPAGGIRHLMPLASLLMGNDVKMSILLDADPSGTNKQKELREKLAVYGMLIDSVTGPNITEIEDLFPEKLYLDAVKQKYPGIDLDFTVEETHIHGISKRVKALFTRQNSKFEKWLPTNLIIEWIHNESTDYEITRQTCEYFEAIFKKVNQSLKNE